MDKTQRKEKIKCRKGNIETTFSFCIVKVQRTALVFGFSEIDFCACVCLHSAHLQVLTPPETVQKVLDSFTLNNFLL